MSEETTKATTEQIESVVNPELSAEAVTVGDRQVHVKPLVRRWEQLFNEAARPLYTAELRGPETVIKAIKDGSWTYTPLAQEIVDGALDADKFLDGVAAVILAAHAPGSEKDPNAAVAAQKEWLKDSATTRQLWALVDKQMEKQDLLALVGERSPVRFARLFSLAGVDLTADTLKQLLNNLLSKLQETPAGAGGSITDKPSG